MGSLSDTVFDPVELGQGEEVATPKQLGHQALVGAEALRRQLGHSPGHLRPAADGPHCLLAGAEGLGIALGIFVAHGDQKSRPVGVFPPLGTGRIQGETLSQGLLALHEAAEDHHEIRHVFMGGGGGVEVVAVEGLLCHRQLLGVAEIIDLMKQNIDLMRDGVLAEAQYKLRNGKKLKVKYSGSNYTIECSKADKKKVDV